MPTITEVLGNEGWIKGVGPNYYFPQDYPHLHLTVANGETMVDDLRDIRRHINFLGITFGDHQNGRNIHIWPLPNVNLRERVSKFLHDDIGLDIATPMQRFINTLTGLGADM